MHSFYCMNFWIQYVCRKSKLEVLNECIPEIYKLKKLHADPKFKRQYPRKELSYEAEILQCVLDHQYLSTAKKLKTLRKSDTSKGIQI